MLKLDDLQQPFRAKIRVFFKLYAMGLSAKSPVGINRAGNSTLIRLLPNPRNAILQDAEEADASQIENSVETNKMRGFRGVLCALKRKVM